MKILKNQLKGRDKSSMLQLLKAIYFIQKMLKDSKIHEIRIKNKGKKNIGKVSYDGKEYKLRGKLK